MAKYVVRPELIEALITAESNWNPNAVSAKGARGLAQIMPATAKDPGFGITPLQDDSVEEQRRFASDYIGAMLDKYDGDERLAVAAYNAGFKNVDKHGDVPPFRETQSYVSKIGRMLNPISSAQADEQIDELDQLWDEINAQPLQAQPDEIDQLWDEINAHPTHPMSGTSGSWDEISPPSALLNGIGGSVLKSAGAIADYFGVDQVAENLMSAANQGLQNAPGIAGKIGKFTGEVAPFVAVPQANIANIGKAGNLLLNVLGMGQMANMMTPGDEEKRHDAAIGTGIATAVSPLIGKALGGIVKGFTPSHEAKFYMNKGVQPTVGEGIKQNLLGKSIRKMEESAASIPILGSSIRHARERTTNEWLKHVTKEIELPSQNISAAGKTGYEAMNNLKKGFNVAYNRNLQGYPVPINNRLINNLKNTIANPGNGLSADAQKIIQEKVDYTLSSMGQGRTTAVEFKEAASSLFNESNSLLKSMDPFHRKMGLLYKNIAFKLNDHRNKFLPKHIQNSIKSIDEKYAKYLTIKEASGSIGAAKNYGEASPAQLLRAIRSSDKSLRKDSFARGEAKLQKDAIMAQRIIGDTLPESGTAPRLITASLLGAGAGVTAPETIMPALLSIMGGSIGSIRPIQKALLGGYQGQHQLAKILEEYAKQTGGAIGFSASQ